MKVVQGAPLPLGVSRQKEALNFAVGVKEGKQCTLLLYKCGENVPMEKIPMKEEAGTGTVRCVMLSDLPAQVCEYNYEIDGKIVTDPYAKGIAGRERWNDQVDFTPHQVRGKIPQKEEYPWENDCPLRIPEEDVIAYSLHVRGFTRHSSSKVKKKGTFRGVMEKLPYLKELGINQIQCMPVYEFEERGRKVNYWGYGEGFFFAPKASYAADHDAQKELKELVKTCHREGIEVVLDFPFTAQTRFQIVEDCLRYYVMEYHIDGFLLNPYQVPVEFLRRDPVLSGTKLLIKDESFQNTMRRFLKGDEGMIASVAEQFRRKTSVSGSCNYITNHTGFTLEDLVSYDAKHNEANGEQNQDGPDYNYSWNCGVEGKTRKKQIVKLRQGQKRNAMFLLMTAQGTPCLLAGDEFGNSQGGNNNVYCQDNETGWVDWSRLEREKSFFHYVKELIAFRKKHGILHQKEALTGTDRSGSGIPDISYHGEAAWQIQQEASSRQLGILYSGSPKKESNCFLVYNMHWIAHSFALPALPKDQAWYQVMSTEEGFYEQPLLIEGKRSIILEGRSVAAFVAGMSQETMRGTRSI
jgi:isoamylase